MSIEEPGKSLGHPLVGIDGSVLMLSAQLLVLCATLLGVEGYDEKMKEILKK